MHSTGPLRIDFGLHSLSCSYSACSVRQHHARRHGRGFCSPDSEPHGRNDNGNHAQANQYNALPQPDTSPFHHRASHCSPGYDTFHAAPNL